MAATTRSRTRWRLLIGQGIATTGAGQNIVEATQPAILEREGVRVAYLGFCTVYPVGYEARDARPGLAPLRVRTYYGDPDPNFWEPGVDPVIETVPMAGDLERYRAAIAAARDQAKLVVVAPHWGYSSSMEVLQDYELQLARDAVDHGADAVMCCHHHALRGVEIYNGKPIFYGLGTLIHHFTTITVSAADRAARLARFGPRSSFAEDDDYPLFPFRIDARKSGVAVLDVAADGTIETGFIPAHMLPDGATEPLRPDDPRAPEVCDYLERLSTQSGFSTHFDRGERDGWMFMRISLMTLVSVADAGSEPEAVMIVARLRDAGIAAMSKATGSRQAIQFGSGATQTIFVDAEQETRAREVLQDPDLSDDELAALAEEAGREQGGPPAI